MTFYPTTKTLIHVIAVLLLAVFVINVVNGICYNTSYAAKLRIVCICVSIVASGLAVNLLSFIERRL